MTLTSPSTAPPDPPPTPEPLPTWLLADIAAGIAQAPGAWQGLVCHDPAERRPVRLVATGAYEVWIIGWTQGQKVRPHDHGGSSAAVLVTEGTLTEVSLLGSRRQLVAGQVHLLGPRVVHDVINSSPVPATSIHVYSPPLTTMTYYDEQTWEPAETETIRSETPVLSQWYGARLLHPAAPPTRPLADRVDPVDTTAPIASHRRAVDPVDSATPTSHRRVADPVGSDLHTPAAAVPARP